MRIRHWLAVAGLCALLLPATVAAQEDTPWAVDLNTGGVIYQEASSLEPGILVGLSALYEITPRLSIGPAVDFVRAQTDETFFVGIIRLGADSSRVHQIGQRVHFLQYSGVARFEVSPDERFNPYVTVGGGGYTLYLETQSNDGFNRISNPMFQVGGGIHYAVSDDTGIQIDVRDVVYTNFDRAELNPIAPADWNCPTPGQPSAACVVPAAERDLPEAEETLHNLRFSIGLTYIPGLNR